MAATPQYAWAMNQAGVKLPAEILRGKHHDATSGGTGVGSPRALKVLPQAAPDSTVMILPGGGTAVSTYAGHESQSYQATNFKPQTLEIPPTGSSSGGRTDLIIQRFLDPNEEPHPDYDGDEYPIPAEVAKDLWYWRFECKQGASETTKFDFPHVKLAEINRPANTTIVNDSHITDLRQLASPKSGWFMNIFHPTEITNIQGGNYHTVGTIQVPIPRFATTAKVRADFSGIAVLRGWVSGQVNGVFPGIPLEPTWYRGHAYSSSHAGSLSAFTAKTITIPDEWRGTVQPFNFRIRRESGTDSGIARTDSGTTLALDVSFEQGIA